MADQQQQDSPKSAPVDEYRVLWTANKTQKLKKWHDGFLRYHSFNRRMLVYDDGRHLVADMYLRDREFLGEGDQLDFEHHLVSIEDFTGSVNQDLTPIFSPALQRKQAVSASPVHTPVPNRRKPPAASVRNGMPNSHVAHQQPPADHRPRPQTPAPAQRVYTSLNAPRSNTPNQNMLNSARPPIVYPAQRQEQAISWSNRIQSPAHNQVQARPVSDRGRPNARPIGRTSPPADRGPPPPPNSKLLPQESVGPPMPHPPYPQSHPQVWPRGGALERGHAPFGVRPTSVAPLADRNHNPASRVLPPLPQTAQSPATGRDGPPPQPNGSPDPWRHSPPVPSRAGRPAPEPAATVQSSVSRIRQFSAPSHGRPPRQPTTPLPRPASAATANSPLGRDSDFYQASRSPSPAGIRPQRKQQASRQAEPQQADPPIAESKSPSPPHPKQRKYNTASRSPPEQQTPQSLPQGQAPAPLKSNKRNSPAATLPAPKRKQTNTGQFQSARTLATSSSMKDEISDADEEDQPSMHFRQAISAATLKLDTGRKKKTLLCSRPPNFRFPDTTTDIGGPRSRTRSDAAESKFNKNGGRSEPRTKPKTVVDEFDDDSLGWDVGDIP